MKIPPGVPLTSVMPDALKGLDVALLDDLRDLVMKFGTDVAGSKPAMRRLSVHEPKEIFVSVGTGPGDLTMMVSEWPGVVILAKAHKLVLDDVNQSFVLWDKSISIADVRALIAAADGAMTAYIDGTTGERRRACVGRFARDKLSVDKVFTEEKRGIGFGNSIGVEFLRRLFDRPDDLRIIADRWGEEVLCRAEDAQSLAADEAATRQVLLTWGMTAKDDLDKLSEKQLRALTAALAVPLRKN